MACGNSDHATQNVMLYCNTLFVQVIVVVIQVVHNNELRHQRRLKNIKRRRRRRKKETSQLEKQKQASQTIQQSATAKNKNVSSNLTTLHGPINKISVISKPDTQQSRRRRTSKVPKLKAKSYDTMRYPLYKAMELFNIPKGGDYFSVNKEKIYAARKRRRVKRLR